MNIYIYIYIYWLFVKFILYIVKFVPCLVSLTIEQKTTKAYPLVRPYLTPQGKPNKKIV